MDTSLISVAAQYGLPGLMLLAMALFIVWVIKGNWAHVRNTDSEHRTERLATDKAHREEREAVMQMHRMERDEWRRQSEEQARQLFTRLNDIMDKVGDLVINKVQMSERRKRN